MADWLTRQVRDLEKEFPGVSSYSTIRNLISLWGVDAARTQLTLWSKAGTSAPRLGRHKKARP